MRIQVAAKRARFAPSLTICQQNPPGVAAPGIPADPMVTPLVCPQASGRVEGHPAVPKDAAPKMPATDAVRTKVRKQRLYTSTDYKDAKNCVRGVLASEYGLQTAAAERGRRPTRPTEVATPGQMRDCDEQRWSTSARRVNGARRSSAGSRSVVCRSSVYPTSPG